MCSENARNCANRNLVSVGGAKRRPSLAREAKPAAYQPSGGTLVNGSWKPKTKPVHDAPSDKTNRLVTEDSQRDCTLKFGKSQDFIYFENDMSVALWYFRLNK